MVTRRAFFARLVGAAAAVVVAPAVAEAIAPAVAPPVVRMMDPEGGISIRFIRQYDVEADRWPTRYDAWYPREAQRAYNALRSAELEVARPW